MLSTDNKTLESTRIFYQDALKQGDEEEAEHWARYLELLSLVSELKNLCIIAKEYNRLPHELMYPNSPMPAIEIPLIIAFLNWQAEQTAQAYRDKKS